MSLETLETKVDKLVESHSNLLGLLEGKVHGSPCPAVVELLGQLTQKQTAIIAELTEKHVRPLEDWRQRATGNLQIVAAVGIVGATLAGILTAIEVLSRLFQ